MPYKKYMVVIAIVALMIPSCQRSLDTGQQTAPTSVFAGNSVPTENDPMAQIAGTATAMANTAVAGGGASATPQEGTSAVEPTHTPEVGLPLTSAAPSSTPEAGSTAVKPAPATSTMVVVTGRPSTYTLQSGEFPWCIARRFNVDPQDLLSLSGLSEGVFYPAGTLLRIPQSGSFPGSRALRAHPTTYTVSSSDETFYSIACLFGDVDPAAIAQANDLTLGSPLTVGQPIHIP